MIYFKDAYMQGSYRATPKAHNSETYLMVFSYNNNSRSNYKECYGINNGNVEI